MSTRQIATWKIAQWHPRYHHWIYDKVRIRLMLWAMVIEQAPNCAWNPCKARTLSLETEFPGLLENLSRRLANKE